MIAYQFSFEELRGGGRFRRAAAEAIGGLGFLKDELDTRPWLLRRNVHRDGDRRCLVVTVEREGSNPSIEGGSGGANFDEVWDCVIATCKATATISFDVEEPVVHSKAWDRRSSTANAP